MLKTALLNCRTGVRAAVTAPMIGRQVLAIATAVCLLDGGATAQIAKRPPPAASPAQATATESAYTAAFDAWRTANDPQTAILVVRRGGKTVFAAGHNTDGNGPSFIGISGTQAR
jgi:hypothetical protein